MMSSTIEESPVLGGGSAAPRRSRPAPAILLFCGPKCWVIVMQTIPARPLPADSFWAAVLRREILRDSSNRWDHMNHRPIQFRGSPAAEDEPQTVRAARKAVDGIVPAAVESEELPESIRIASFSSVLRTCSDQAATYECCVPVMASAARGDHVRFQLHQNKEAGDAPAITRQSESAQERLSRRNAVVGAGLSDKQRGQRGRRIASNACVQPSLCRTRIGHIGGAGLTKTPDEQAATAAVLPGVGLGTKDPVPAAFNGNRPVGGNPLANRSTSTTVADPGEHHSFSQRIAITLQPLSSLPSSFQLLGRVPNTLAGARGNPLGTSQTL